MLLSGKPEDEELVRAVQARADEIARSQRESRPLPSQLRELDAKLRAKTVAVDKAETALGDLRMRVADEQRAHEQRMTELTAQMCLQQEACAARAAERELLAGKRRELLQAHAALGEGASLPLPTLPPLSPTQLASPEVQRALAALEALKVDPCEAASRAESPLLAAAAAVVTPSPLPPRRQLLRGRCPRDPSPSDSRARQRERSRSGYGSSDGGGADSGNDACDEGASQKGGGPSAPTAAEMA